MAKGNYTLALCLAELMEAIVTGNLLAGTDLGKANQLGTACRNAFASFILAAAAVKPLEDADDECRQAVQSACTWLAKVVD